MVIHYIKTQMVTTLTLVIPLTTAHCGRCMVFVVMENVVMVEVVLIIKTQPIVKMMVVCSLHSVQTACKMEQIASYQVHVVLVMSSVILHVTM
jgi:hypothetical protein